MSIKLKSGFFFVLSIALLLSLPVHCQYYDAGQDPFSIKWAQIISRHFQVIYPIGFEENAFNVVKLMEKDLVLNSLSLKAKVSRIPVILHNRMALSNGFVIWAPRRTEFYTTPPQDSYAEDWLGQLAIHEGRHIVQFSKLKQGFTRFLGWILGEQAYDIVTAVFIPMWFMEGDAVCAETVHSNSGRGRLPYFEMKLKAQVIGKKIYSYDKAVFGSYHDFIPDRYSLGYHLVAWSREKYSYKLWDRTIDYVARYPFLAVPFSLGIRKTTKRGKEALYKEAMKALQTRWKNQTAQLSLSKECIYPVRHHADYVNYTKPYYINDSTILCQKSGMNDIESFILYNKNTNKEKKVYIPGLKVDDNLSYSNNTLVWAEIQPDKRWENRNYSSIRSLNLQTNKYEEITEKVNYFAPALNHQGDQLVAVKVSTDLKYSLTIIGLSDHKIIADIPSPGNRFIMTPAWSDMDSMIVFVALCDSGKCLMAYNTKNFKFNQLYPASFSEISKPAVSGQLVYFIGSWSGIDNIYTLDLQKGKVAKITSSIYGCDFPEISTDGSTVLFSEYTPNGYRIAELKMKDVIAEPMEKIKDNSIKLHQYITSEETQLQSTVPDTTIVNTKTYSKVKNMFHFHSWGPLSINVDNTTLNPGLTLVSQDLLSTTFITGGYEYNLNEMTGKYFAKFTYKGFYPVIDFYADYGKRADSYTASDNSRVRYTWDEINLRANISVPLNLTRTRFYQGMIPSVQLTTFNIIHDNTTPANFLKGWFYSVDYRLLFYYYLKKTSRQLIPRFGQIYEINYRHSPFGDNHFGKILAFEITTYFPGIMKSHGIKVYTAIEQRQPDKYRYSDLIMYARGYKSLSFNKSFSFKSEYKLPLLYPDLSIPCILYLKRISLTGFFDICGELSAYYHEYYRSAGAELLAEMHIFRFIAPLNIGLRTSYMLETGKFKYELLFSFDFSSF